MSADSHTLTAVIPLAVKPRGGRKAIITPGVLEVAARHDITLIKAVARAFRWLRIEPPRVSRRLFGLSHAAMSCCSSIA